MRIVDGAIQLKPLAAMPIELSTEERIAEFLAAAEMTPQELEASRKAWDSQTSQGCSDRSSLNHSMLNHSMRARNLP